MFGLRWRLFRLLGIPVSVDVSWLLILALLTLSFAEGFPSILQAYFPGDVSQLPPGAYWIMGLVTALAFFTCIVLHEFGHALVARSRGTPIKGITLFLFGGVSELGDEPKSAGSEFLIAVAGPAVSAVLAVLFWVAAAIGYQGGWPHPVVIILGYLATINGVVLIFNMVPAFPLDGGRVLRSILWGLTGSLRRATRWASFAGHAFAWLLIGLGILEFFAHNWVGGMWSVLIGMFLNAAARSGYQQVLIQQALQGEPVRRFMNSNPVLVPPSLDLHHWVEDYVYRYHHRTFAVASDARLEGVVTTEALKQIPKADWGDHAVSEVMATNLPDLTIAADADALMAFQKMQRTGAGQLVVTEGDRVLGIVGFEDLLPFLKLNLEFAGTSDNSSHKAPPESRQPPRREELALHH